MFDNHKKKKPTVLKFDLLETSAPMIVGLDVLKYATIDNMQRKLSFKAPTDKSERLFYTYTAIDVGGNN